ncbi:fungal-specific transcription factor domain-domain-containing protein [Clohesyomyces aquaticus]|uniref:Fungal-specific transcription factor domain-domain-containing protein n=1 Tax=Clohesyomyces aquaticus TaxID=1231657 RepID=A0A1Y2A4A2_9PLEO|nr:fungal-specific transcription factor domain-domain-containing protein [Clohesyomyces aquaticus]
MAPAPPPPHNPPSSSIPYRSPESSGTSPSNRPAQKSFSCVLCSSRKVKCDKSPGGCGNCTRARVQCTYKAPPPPRRRRKGVREFDAHARLRLYEDALRKLGVDPADLEQEELHKLQARRASLSDGKNARFLSVDNDVAERGDTDAGVLVSGDGKSIYLENRLWTSLQGEFRDSNELLDESSEDEPAEDSVASSPEAFGSDGGNLLLGLPRNNTKLRHFHPQPVQIFKFWQIYLDNVNPLVKLFHTPTIQQQVLHGSGDLDDIPKPLEALLFGMYCISLASIGDAECNAIMGESKAVVMIRFRTAAQHALVNANFLKSSDIMVLQAFVLFLLSLQNYYDARVTWILTGVAGRIAQRLGLHRDGETLGLPPFETEIRRRLWWQVMFMEGFAEKLAGIGSQIFMGDARSPSNLNDSDLFPGMKELPKEHDGATEMMHFLMRVEGGQFLRRAPRQPTNFDGLWNRLSAGSLAAKDKAIADLEAMYQRRFLQYCDKSVPWHFMCSYTAKAMICMMRFMAHQPEIDDQPGCPKPQEEIDYLFNLSLQVVSYMNLAYTMKELQGFLWHINLNFQWKVFIYLIAQLRYRTAAPDADEAWKQVQLVFEYHPNFAKEVSKRALPIAVGNLTLKAWNAFIAARGVPAGGEPYYIQIQRAQQRGRSKSPSIPPSQPEIPAPVPPALEPCGAGVDVTPIFPQNLDPLQSFGWDSTFASSLDVAPMPELPNLDGDQLNWPAWENLVMDFSMEPSSVYSNSNGNAYGYGAL